jgi:hypothetical protein
MKTFEQWLKDERGIEMPKGEVSASWFTANCLPMIVQCSCCYSTMALPSAMIDKDGSIYCPSCVE